MTIAVLDTNVLVQSLISSAHSASARVLDAYYDGRFQLPYTSETVDELVEALTISHIRTRHGLSDDEMLEFVASLLARGESYPVEVAGLVPADIARDVTDTKFLALIKISDADFLVTNDRRHLLRLRRFGRTQIVTPAEFLRKLP
jgi:putative PIN family toxin of toxin-antitoxin system